MKSHLMSAAGDRMHCQQRVPAEPLARRVLADCDPTPSLGNDCHSLSVTWVSSYGRLNPAAWRRRAAVHERQIRLLDLAVMKLPLEPDQCGIALGQND